MIEFRRTTDDHSRSIIYGGKDIGMLRWHDDKWNIWHYNDDTLPMEVAEAAVRFKQEFIKERAACFEKKLKEQVVLRRSLNSNEEKEELKKQVDQMKNQVKDLQGQVDVYKDLIKLKTQSDSSDNQFEGCIKPWQDSY